MGRTKRIENKLDKLVDSALNTQEHLIKINEEQKEIIKFVKNHSVRLEQIENRLTEVELKVNWIMTHEITPKIKDTDEIFFEEGTIDN